MMTSAHIAYVIVAVLTLGAALRVVTHRRPFHAALWLALTFVGMSAIFMFLDSPYLAGVQLFIGAGGIAVAIAIAAAITKAKMREATQSKAHRRSAFLVSVVLFAVLSWMIVQLPLPEAPPMLPADEGLAHVGAALVDPQGYLLPVMVVSWMLLVVLIGGLYLARRR
jgi:NADH-quinone oxidoreductase subunit J